MDRAAGGYHHGADYRLWSLPQDALKLPPCALDASLAVGIAVLTALSLGFAGEESYKYLNPYVRFWLVLCVGATVQGLHALSKFRDGTFQRQKEIAVRQEEADKSGVASAVVNTVKPNP